MADQGVAGDAARRTNARGDDDPPMLALGGVNKRFPGVQALSDMHLDLNYGEVLALVGENGAGKSTLMNLLSGVHAPDTGGFELDGVPVEIDTPRDAQRYGIGIIHQEFNLMSDLTVAQNIFIGREPATGRFWLRDRDLYAGAGELFDRLGLNLDPRARVGDLSVAEQQMTEIAKALATDARILIMDEPSAALNDAEVQTLFNLIRRFVTDRTGVIYISHRMEELTEIADRITVIRDGQYVDTVNPATTGMPEVISLMVGRQIDDDQARKRSPPEADRDVVLSVDNLSTKTLLDQVSFELRAGEILGFAGLMGAGRTEVARAIVGADTIISGDISVHGRKVAIKNPAAAAKLGIGYLSEDRKRYGLMLDRSITDNVVITVLQQFSGLAGFLNDRQMRTRASQQVERMRIKTPSVGTQARNLSGGNQQKVVIAKWLVKDCDILIFDEPSRGIDVGAKQEIYRLLEELAADGKAIIMISSELPEVLQLSDRVLVMNEGRRTATLTSDEANQETIMHYATLGAQAQSDSEPAGGVDRDSGQETCE